MSAPQTNIEKQKRNHRWGLIATIGSIVVVAIIVVTGFFTTTVDDPGAPMQPSETPATE